MEASRISIEVQFIILLKQQRLPELKQFRTPAQLQRGRKERNAEESYHIHRLSLSLQSLTAPDSANQAKLPTTDSKFK